MVFLVLPVAALALGACALHPFGVKNGGAGLLARLCAGAALCGLVTLSLGGIALALARWALIAIAAGGLTYEVFLRKRRDTGTADGAEPASRATRGALFWLGMAAAAAGVIVAAVPAGAPATQLETVSGALAAAKDYDFLGRMVPYDGADSPAYATLAQCLYTWAYAGGGEGGARMLSWLLAVFAAAAVYVLAHRLSGPCAGAVAAGAFAATPVFLNRAAAVSGDLLGAGLVLASLTALLVWRAERARVWLALAGVFLGSAWDGRWTCLLLCCAAVPFVACLAKETRGKQALVFAAALAAGLAPWMLARAAAGAPFLLPVVPEAQYAAETGVLALLKFPWNLVLRPHWYGGWTTAPGGLLLILGVPGLVVGGKRVRWLCGFAAICGLALYAVDRSHVAFLPLTAVFVVAAAVGACRLAALRPLILVALAAVLLQGLCINGWTAAAAVRGVGRPGFVAQRVPRYEAIRWANDNLPSGRRILTPDPCHYFFDLPTFRDLHAVAGLNGADPGALRDWLRERGIAYLVFPETHVRAHRDAYPEGAVEVLDQWRGRQSEVFVLIQVLKVPAVDSAGVEQVEIYEVRNGAATGPAS